MTIEDSQSMDSIVYNFPTIGYTFNEIRIRMPEDGMEKERRNCQYAGFQTEPTVRFYDRKN